MLNIKNKTPFHVAPSLQTNLQGHDCVLVFFAASFYLSNNRWYVSDKQIATPLTDEYWDPDKPSSIRYPSQLSHNKPGTDVIINAHAVAPKEQPVSALKAGIRIADLEASVVVFGDRMWHKNAITAPRTFVQMPIVWERAFGGVSSVPEDPEKWLQHDSNPLGLGWTHPSHQPKDGTQLPNIEWHDQLINKQRDCPPPAGFGALGPESPHRACHAGTYDEQWKKNRCPYAPLDFDPAFFHSAIPALRSPTHLQGNEAVRLRNMNAIDDIAFNLPHARPAGSATINNVAQPLSFNLETVVIETLTLEVTLFWQASTAASRSVADVEEIEVWLAR